MLDLGNARDPLLAVVEALKECTNTMQRLASVMETAGSAPVAEAAGTRAPTSPLAWPAFMTTSMAARYCGYKTPGGLKNACDRGLIKPAGKRGGVGNCMWARTDLDAFLRGERQDDRVGRHGRVAGRAPSARRDRDRGAAASLEDSLCRIRETARSKR
jgi:hypothetical protein